MKPMVFSGIFPTDASKYDSFHARFYGRISAAGIAWKTGGTYAEKSVHTASSEEDQNRYEFPQLFVSGRQFNEA